jgi:thioredoxin 1
LSFIGRLLGSEKTEADIGSIRKRHTGTMPARVVLSGSTVTKGQTNTMANENGYAKTAPTRAEVDALAGATVLEFGADWCGYCQGAQRHIAESLRRAPSLRHLKIEDGPGRPLGRSFKVKLWPTLIFLRDGVEVARVVRPTEASAIDEGLAALR